MAKFNKVKKEKKSWVISTKKYSYAWWALPLIPVVEIIDYIQNKIDSHRIWSDEKAKKVLDKVLPKVLDYVEEDNAFYYCMDWSEWGLFDNAPLIYRKWVKKFKYRLHKFIQDNYENEDYVKTFENDGYYVWVKFSEK